MASSQQELDVLESWEDMDGVDVIEKQFKSILTPLNNNNNSNGLINMSLNFNLTGNDALPSYVPEQPTTVKILKRTSQNIPVTDPIKNVLPKKTLQQREQEYAEARLRILGEDKSDEKYVSIQNKSYGTTIGTTTTSPALTNSQLESNIIRLPKGPDGTNGFHIRR